MVWAIVVVAALLLAVIATRGLADDRQSRMLQVLVMICATPFLSPPMELGHLVPLILPVFLVAPMAWRERKYWPLAMIVGGWAVISYHQLSHGSWGSWAPGESLWEASGGLGAVAVYAGVLVVALSPRPASDGRQPRPGSRNAGGDSGEYIPMPNRS